MLEHVHHRVPVTALAFLGDHVILSGEGGQVRAYDVNTRVLLATVSVFEGQAVHGIIAQDETDCTVWGASLIRTLRCKSTGDSEALRLEVVGLFHATDWILDAAYSQLADSAGERLAAFVTAHNALAVTRTSALTKGDPGARPSRLEPLIPGSNCILYSAHIRWISPSHCLIASGTAFGDVIVWSAFISCAGDGTLSAKAETHYTFSAHEGSVFGVCISVTLNEGMLGSCRRALATCSDDRTVRLWDISDLAAESPSLTQVQRDTGFGAKSQDNEHSPQLLATAMGHVSRVWHVRFKYQHNGQTLEMLSSGEDACDITWAVKICESTSPGCLPYILEQVQVRTLHAGKHIWSVAMSSQGCVASGGAEGAVALRASPNQSKSQGAASQILLDQNADGNIKSYGFVADWTLLATTSQGKVLLLDLVIDLGAGIRKIAPALPGLRGYSVVAAVSGTAFVGGADGTVYIYHQEHKRLLEIFNTGRKTAGLFAHSRKRHHDQDAVSVLVTGVGCDSATLLHLDSGVSPGLNMIPIVQTQWQLSLSSTFTVTSFTQVIADNYSIAILGSRSGSIAIYDLYVPGVDEAGEPLAHWDQVHGREAVTSLLWVSSSPDSREPMGFLYSIGRDGTLAVHHVADTDAGWRSKLVHQLTLPFGPNIEGLSCRPDSHVWVWGFRSKHFVVYDVTDQREVMAVECGGAHRNWAFQPRDEGGYFSWTKALKVYQQSQTELPYHLISSGGHGREIKAVAVSWAKPQIIATGAEDTNIKLWNFDKQTGFRCLQTVMKHNTGIQHLQWSRDGDLLFSSGGFEEFFVWRVTRNVPGVGMGVVRESRHPKSGKSDLRIMGFHVAESDGDFMISMAYSDSSTKCWQYRSAGQQWELFATGDYLTACLTQVLSVGYSGTVLLTAATDGHLTTWDTDVTKSTLEWSRRHKVHQNAVLSIAKHTLTDGSSLVITGGDDNAIGLTRIAKEADGARTLLLPRAHAAAVTGLAIVRKGSDQLLLASASIDQRVKLWQVEIEVDHAGVDGLNVKMLGNTPTAVADVSSLDAFELEDGSTGLLVCGVGMDMWRVAKMIDDCR